MGLSKRGKPEKFLHHRCQPALRQAPLPDQSFFIPMTLFHTDRDDLPCRAAIFLYGKTMIRSSADFGALVRARRKALGWTQAQLAARCGTGERFIVELERGKPTCHLEKSFIAARAVGIELGDMKSAGMRDAGPDDDALAHLPRFGG
jgi:y4mF family transcriptional regulator